MKEFRMNIHILYLAFVKILFLVKKPLKEWMEDIIISLCIFGLVFIIACILYQVEVPIPVLFN